MNGHSKGDQLVLVNCGGERIAYGSHLIPTIHHVPLKYIPAFDLSPENTMEEKIKFLDIAQRQGWLLVFGHGMEQRAGYVESLNGRTKLRLVEF